MGAGNEGELKMATNASTKQYIKIIRYDFADDGELIGTRTDYGQAPAWLHDHAGFLEKLGKRLYGKALSYDAAATRNARDQYPWTRALCGSLDNKGKLIARILVIFQYYGA